ncbi:SDR family oxidoreductase [Nostoc spongiaeforme FACHB-130]|uniref:SDR family oxidoreductase n=1 Tax=Nostoc spongiaeforme FACHB-130 TaxID=1357510 RepID=A0ABR8FX58_9NOSO|nr:SDR family oxidoreductase [Nostoc spongiaeforme]MBD2595712.1 SDR family oxidoreductase [Nostoc spongiaeforme FACHB-130]
MMRKTVLITGASSGIGEATAKYFLNKGWNVAATMRSPQKAGDWTKAKNIICPYLDVTNPDTIESALHETLAAFGQIDVLVNNAGYALMGPLEGVTPEQLEHQFQTNFFGLVSTIQKILPILRRQGGGTIINVASIGGRLAFPLVSSYHATKWAVEGLSESLRYELRSFGIRVKIIEPGGIKTNFINHGIVWANHPAYTDMVYQVKSFNEKINDSLAAPEGVAKTIYRAASDRSARLRYSPYGEAFLVLHAILPDKLWRSLVETVMLRTTK